MFSLSETWPYLLHHASVLPAAVLQAGQESIQCLSDVDVLLLLSTGAQRRQRQPQTQHTAGAEETEVKGFKDFLSFIL